IVVVGAGVIGLSCALRLAEDGYDITVIATQYPTDPLSINYTSSWAGAHFRPFPSKEESDLREASYTRATQAYMTDLAQTSPESSVVITQGEDWLETPDQYYKELAHNFGHDLPNFEVLDKQVVKSNFPSNVNWVCRYTTWCLNAPLYIQYLARRLQMNYHAKFIVHTLKSLSEVDDLVPVNAGIINCSGTGLQLSGQYDPKCFPIRGQTLLVRPPKGKLHPYSRKTITHQAANGLWTFVIPRPLDGGYIIGGTKQPGDMLPTPREKDTRELMARAYTLYPELADENGNYDVIRVNVGRRPAREGGSRVELEHYGGNNDKWVVHAYGLGGMGFETSRGVADHVAKLV
ncbi:FAD dependent oxidoreductase, partial [Nadsonia fulvescens var. elongata DSM 6958]